MTLYIFLSCNQRASLVAWRSSNQMQGHGYVAGSSSHILVRVRQEHIPFVDCVLSYLYRDQTVINLQHHINSSAWFTSTVHLGKIVEKVAVVTPLCTEGSKRTKQVAVSNKLIVPPGIHTLFQVLLGSPETNRI